jgi:hypothetical protein
MTSIATLKREIAIVQKAIAPLEQTQDSILLEIDRENTAKTIRCLIINSKLIHKAPLTAEDLAFIEAEQKEHEVFTALYEAGKIERRKVVGKGTYYFYTETDNFYRGICRGMTSEHLLLARQVAETVINRQQF